MFFLFNMSISCNFGDVTRLFCAFRIGVIKFARNENSFVVPSCGQPEAFRFEDPMFEKDYGMFKAYANSKLALLMFAQELQQRLDREKSNVIVNSANPGGVLDFSCFPAF